MLSRRGPLFYCVHVFLFALFSFANRNARLPGEARSGKQARGPSSAPPYCRRRRRRRAVRVRVCVAVHCCLGSFYCKPFAQCNCHRGGRRDLFLAGPRSPQASVQQHSLYALSPSSSAKKESPSFILTTCRATPHRKTPGRETTGLAPKYGRRPDVAPVCFKCGFVILQWRVRTGGFRVGGGARAVWSGLADVPRTGLSTTYGMNRASLRFGGRTVTKTTPFQRRFLA